LTVPPHPISYHFFQDQLLIKFIFSCSDETPEERFLKNLRHIDFSFHEEDEKSGAKQKAKQQAPANVWDNFAQSIGYDMPTAL